MKHDTGRTRAGSARRGWPPRISGDLRRLAPFLLLALALLIAGVGALQAHRAQRSHQATARALVRDYGTFAAWSFSQRATEEVGRAVRGPLYPLRTGLLRARTPLPCVEEVLEAARGGEGGCGCGGAIGGDFAFFLRVAPGVDTLLTAGRGPDPATRRALTEALAAHARSAYRSDWRHSLLHLPRPGGGEAILAYTRLENSEGDTIVYGYEVDPEKLAAEFRHASDDDLLPPSLTGGAANSALLSLSAVAPSGRVLYASHPGQETELPAEQEMPGSLGGGRATAAVLPSAVDGLIIGGLPRSQTPWLLLIFTLAAGLAVVSISLLRRENQLARLRSDFVASVSHELRTPLAQIRLFIETLRLGRARTQEQREWALGSIDRETLRLTHLVENVLLFSRMDRGVRHLRAETVELASEVQAVVDGFRPLLRAGQAEIEVQVPAEIAVALDRECFRQVLLNLLENAVKYGPRGQTIRAGAAIAGARVRLAIDDEGPGVAPRERERIFEPFRRGEDATGSVAVGSGIGLSIVRDIVSAHGGAVRVEQAPSGGARFVVELPVASAPWAAQASLLDTAGAGSTRGAA